MGSMDQGAFGGRTVAITGAAGGMGRAMAVEFFRQGAKLVLLDLSIERIAAVVADLPHAEGRVLALACDISKEESVAKAVEEAEAWSQTDVLVNCAGLLPPASRLESITAEEWDLAFAVNVRGAMFCTQAFGRGMLKRGRGAIVNIASIAVELPNVSAVYGATKGAVRALTHQIAVEWGPRGVRANTVSPGMIVTPMTHAVYADPQVQHDRATAVALRRPGQPEEISAVAVFLASDAASYVNGEEIVVDGGFRHTALMRLQAREHQPQPPY